MKVLVVHPNDKSTEFLKKVYNNKNYTVVCIEKCSKSLLKKMISEHDKIIMLGHGSPDGLYSGKQDRFIIDSSLVYLLREKYCVGIWCYASDFATKYNLKGLFTGMIISEMDEAYLNCVDCSENDILQSNMMFSELINKIENFHSKQSILFAKQFYYSEKNNVIKFNRERIYSI